MLRVSAQDTPLSIASGAAREVGESRRRDGAAPEMMAEALAVGEGAAGELMPRAWQQDTSPSSRGGSSSAMSPPLVAGRLLLRAPA